MPRLEFQTATVMTELKRKGAEEHVRTELMASRPLPGRTPVSLARVTFRVRGRYRGFQRFGARTFSS